MKTVWAQFLVPEDGDEDQVAWALEKIFRQAEGSAIVHSNQRRALDCMRSVPFTGLDLQALRTQAALTVHLSYDYGYAVAQEVGIAHQGEVVSVDVDLWDPAPDGSTVRAVLEVRFEPETALVRDATAYGALLSRPGRRLDPYLPDTDDLSGMRLDAAEAALTVSGCTAMDDKAWYQDLQDSRIEYRREVLFQGSRSLLRVTFVPGSNIVSNTEIERDHPQEHQG